MWLTKYSLCSRMIHNIFNSVRTCMANQKIILHYSFWPYGENDFNSLITDQEYHIKELKWMNKHSRHDQQSAIRVCWQNIVQHRIPVVKQGKRNHQIKGMSATNINSAYIRMKNSEAFTFKRGISTQELYLIRKKNMQQMKHFCLSSLPLVSRV